jgi:hypothetical protein
MAVSDFAAAGQRQLTLSEAERLARAAVPETTKRPPSLYLERTAIPPRNGARFDVWALTTSGLVRARSLLVDLDTAEVWDAASCERVLTADLRTVQRVIRRELNILSTEVDRARAVAEKNGCSNLVDQTPKPMDLHSAPLIKIEAAQQGTSYRYTFMSGGCGYVGASPVPLNIRAGEIRFTIMGNSIYVMDEDKQIRELHYELQFLSPPPPPNK